MAGEAGYNYGFEFGRRLVKRPYTDRGDGVRALIVFWVFWGGEEEREIGLYGVWRGSRRSTHSDHRHVYVEVCHSIACIVEVGGSSLIAMLVLLLLTNAGD